MVADFVNGLTEVLKQFGDALVHGDLSLVWTNEALLFAIILAATILIYLTLFSSWMFWRNKLFEESFKSILLEIRIPREILKSPRAMEQVFFSLHALRNTAGDSGEYFLDGEVVRWYSLEVVSFGGEVHFYVRCPFKQRNLVEAAFLGYYQDIELLEVDDYSTTVFPRTLQDVYAQGYDMYGAELHLARPDAYPLRSYVDFDTADEAQLFDPVTNMIEVLSKIKPEEMVGIQILFYPLGPTWRKEWKPLVEELRQSKQKKGGAKTAVMFPGGPMPHLDIKKSEEDEFGKLSRAFMRTPGETEVLKRLEANLDKPAFCALIRFLYFSPKSSYYDSFPRRAVIGTFNQYSDLGSNYFKLNYKGATRVKWRNFPHFFPGLRGDARKHILLYNYQERNFPPEHWMGKVLTSSLFQWNIKTKTFQITTESLATIFHLPTMPVLTAPHIRRVESKKGGPPAGLPIFGDEEKIKQFM